MIVKIFKNDDYASRAAADIIIAQISAKPNSVIGLPTGGTPVKTYQTLIQAFQEGRVSFKNVKTFNLDEYVGLDPTHEQSYRYFMNDKLFSHIDILIENTHLPCSEDPEKYDDEIIAAGGLDLQVLGIGNNGHIAFNEPGGKFDSLTHKQRITEETREANKRFFGNDINKVPEYAVTLGIKGIMNARKIIQLAFGKGKAKAIYDTVRGPVNVDVPSGVLQLHPDCTLLIDEAAAELL